MDSSIRVRVQQSYQRCIDHYAFLPDFYCCFIDSSPLVAESFSNTDMDHQVLMLRVSLEMLLDDSQPAENWPDLQRIAELHSRRERNIPPELYQQWLDSLMITVRKHDPEYSGSLEHDWRQLLQPAIDFMKGCY